mgnify:CR=1 FL=1|tara:strand:+ start:246 stop:428 length:183 start_codon:yes stop_codon:yes gene_type:complete
MSTALEAAIEAIAGARPLMTPDKPTEALFHRQTSTTTEIVSSDGSERRRDLSDLAGLLTL